MLAKAAMLLSKELTTLRVLTSSGVIHPYPPHVLVRMARALREWGMGPAGGFTALAVRAPDQVGIVDELGELTFRQVHERSNALARGLRDVGVHEGDSVAVLCRNHRGFVDATVAVSKLGADLLYLNTAFAAPQLGEVCEREKPAAIIYDEEFDGLVEKARIEVPRIHAWQDGETDLPTLEQMIRSHASTDLTPPGHRSRA